MRLQVLAIILAASTAVEGGRILAVLPMTARSHNMFFISVLRTLANAGHEVVHYSSIPQDPTTQGLDNYTYIEIDTVTTFTKADRKNKMHDFGISPSIVCATKQLWRLKGLSEETLQCKEIKRLLKSEEKFHLVILEALFAQEVLLGFGYRFRAPVLALQPFGAFSLINQAAGNSLSLSFIPDYGLTFFNQMSFYERIVNAYSVLSSLYAYYYEFLPQQEVLMRSAFNDSTMPPIVDLVHGVALFVSNIHPTVHYAQPYTPNMINIGGIHLSSQTEPLSKDLKAFMDGATSGVIYFSLGSLLPEELLKAEFFSSFTSTFKQLPQRVVWKTGLEISDLPQNVMTANWLPQEAILAHPNVVLFITHGGLFSLHETIHAGIPVVSIPLFGDQPMNSRFYEERGLGVKLDLNSITPDNVHETITTVLNNPRYNESATWWSKVYRDRPVSPADTLVFWVNHVLRHGSTHLRPTSADMPWYQLILIDVTAAILASAATVLALIYLLLRAVYRRIVNRKRARSNESREKED